MLFLLMYFDIFQRSCQTVTLVFILQLFHNGIEIYFIFWELIKLGMRYSVLLIAFDN